METTHIVTMMVTRRSGTAYYHFNANYSANQVGGRIAFGFMKVADSLAESDVNLFLFPENDQLAIYEYGRTYEGRITKIGQVDGEPYLGLLNDGAKVEFSIKSALDAELDADDDAEAEDDDEADDDVPPVHMDGKHLLFKNIPIDGTLEEFCAQLAGYELTYADDEDCVYVGKYAGRPATLFVTANPETGMVYRVIVELRKWRMGGSAGVADIIGEDYAKVLDAFREKYGEDYADEQYDFDDDSAGDPAYEDEFIQEVADGDSSVEATFRFESDESQWYSKITVNLEFGQDDDDEDDPGSWYGCVNISFIDGENEPFPEDDDDEEDVEDDEEYEEEDGGDEEYEEEYEEEIIIEEL